MRRDDINTRTNKFMNGKTTVINHAISTVTREDESKIWGYGTPLMLFWAFKNLTQQHIY